MAVAVLLVLPFFCHACSAFLLLLLAAARCWLLPPAFVVGEVRAAPYQHTYISVVLLTYDIHIYTVLYSQF